MNVLRDILVQISQTKSHSQFYIIGFSDILHSFKYKVGLLTPFVL